MSTLMVLLDASAKSAVLIAVALVCMVPLRRASASARHLVWCLTLAGVVLLPAMSVLLPRFDVPVLPERTLAGDISSSAPVHSYTLTSSVRVSSVETNVSLGSSDVTVTLPATPAISIQHESARPHLMNASSPDRIAGC